MVEPRVAHARRRRGTGRGHVVGGHQCPCGPRGHSYGRDVTTRGSAGEGPDGYYVAYKPITLSSILFMFVEMKFIHCHSCVMFAMKSMSRCND